MSGGARVAVIGGGLGGLTAARALLGRGLDVDVLEASGRAGGVIETSREAGYAREHGAGGVLDGVPGGAAELAAELGVPLQRAGPAAKNRWVFAGGRLRAVPSDPLSFLTTDLVSPGAKLRLLIEPLMKPRRGESSVADFFRHHLGAEIHDRVVAPFVTGIFAGDTETLSLEAAFPRIAELANRGGLLRGAVATALAGRRAGRPRQRPRLAAPAGGMERLIEALVADLDSRLRLETPVAAIAGDADGVVLTLGNGATEIFDCAVCAAPAHVTARLFADVDGELAGELTRIPTVPIAVAHLGYRREQIRHPLDGFGFLVAPGESPPILGAVFESQLWPDRAPEGAVLLRCMIGGSRHPELLERSDRELIDTAAASLASILDIDGRPEHENLVRWSRAIPQYTLGHAGRVERCETLAASHRSVLAGASYRGVAVNSIAADAARVTRRIGELLAAPLSVVVACAIAATAACSGAKGSGRAEPGDAAAIAEEELAPVNATIDGYTVVEGAEGSIRVQVTFPDPPAAHVRSPGVDRCGESRRPGIRVHALGGVAGAAVWLEGVTAGIAPPAALRRRLTYRRCRLEPRVVALPRLGATLDVVTADEPTVELTLAPAGGEPTAWMTMAPIGRGFRHRLDRGGVYQVGGDGIDDGWAVVAGTPYLALTDEAGAARFAAVPDGSYQVRVWHPPVADGAAPLTAAGDVAVKGGVATIAIELE